MRTEKRDVERVLKAKEAELAQALEREEGLSTRCARKCSSLLVLFLVRDLHMLLEYLIEYLILVVPF